MRKLFLVAVAGAVAAAYRRRQLDRSEAELWAEATAPRDMR